MKILRKSYNWLRILAVFVVCFSISLLIWVFIVNRPFNPISSTNNQTNSSVKPVNDNGSEENYSAEGNTISQNRDLWKSKEIVNYNMVMRLVSSGLIMSAKAVTIKVRKNKDVSIEPIPKEINCCVGYYTDFDTVEKLFDLLEKEHNRKAKIEVRFNPEFGYPESVDTVYLDQKGMDAHHLYIDKLEIVKEDE